MQKTLASLAGRVLEPGSFRLRAVTRFRVFTGLGFRVQGLGFLQV